MGDHLIYTVDRLVNLLHCLKTQGDMPVGTFNNEDVASAVNPSITRTLTIEKFTLLEKHVI